MKMMILCLAAALGATSCMDNDRDNPDRSGNASRDTVQQQVFVPEIRLELHIGQRRLHVFRGNDTVRSYPVAVGKPDHPTPTGEFQLHQIDWNPDWNPPDSEWAEDRTPKKPGEKNNPMGRARIIYQMPYTLHGTEELESLGKAASHGSVRLANNDIIELGKMLMHESNTHRDTAWLNRVLNNPKEMVSVELTAPIPLRNIP